MNKKLIIFLIIVLLFFICCQKNQQKLKIIGTWGGVELETFKKICKYGNFDVDFETTRDLDAVLTIKSQANNLPDMAILPNPSRMKELIKNGNIKSINYIDKEVLLKNYSETWINLASYAGEVYGIFIKAANKSIIWYNPEEFKKNNWKIPLTWDELILLSKKIIKDGKVPWAIGADIGWPLTDWIENIFVRINGQEMYDKWIYHKIPWSHSAVKKSFIKWGEIVKNPDFLYGGINGTLSMKFQNAAFQVFIKPPKAYLYYEGDFIGNIILAEIPDIKQGIDIDFFPFPEIDKKYKVPVVGGADIIVAFNEKPQVKKLMRFLVSKEANEMAAKYGFITPNKNVNLKIYQDILNKKSAEMLQNAEIFVFDASDMMPPAVGNQGGFWDACKKFLYNPEKLDEILNEMEKLAKKNI